VVAFLAPPDDAGIGQHGQVLGNVLLGGRQRRRQLAHRRFAVAEPVEQLDPHGLADHTEAAGDQLDQVVGEGVREVHHVTPCGINEVVV
jgi:hypothetical protein